MLFEHRCGEERRFEAVGGVMTDHAAKTAERRATWWRLGVVGQRVEVPLDSRWGVQARDEPPFGGREAGTLARLPQGSFCIASTSCSGVQSAPVKALASRPWRSMIAVRRV